MTLHSTLFNTKGNPHTCGFTDQAHFNTLLMTGGPQPSGLRGTLHGKGLVIFSSQISGRTGPEQMNEGMNDKHAGEGQAH